MSSHQLVYLSRNDYITSIATITDSKTVNFANMSLRWWDKKYGWHTQGCVALIDSDNIHLSYIFYHIDRYKEYITIHNIFTPMAKRRNGYANILLAMIFDLALTKNVSRFKLTSISKSLDFYLFLGFIYWGVNSVGDYYCDLPMPRDGLAGVDYMIKNTDTAVLIGKKFEKIYAKTENNNTNLSVSQTLIYDNDLLKLGNHYMLDLLIDIKNKIRQ
jgi:hypothetical protein